MTVTGLDVLIRAKVQVGACTYSKVLLFYGHHSVNAQLQGTASLKQNLMDGFMLVGHKGSHRVISLQLQNSSSASRNGRDG